MRKQSHIFRTVLKTMTGVFLAGLLLWTAVYASDAGDRRKQEERLQTSGTVLSEVLNMPEKAAKFRAESGGNAGVKVSR